MRGACLSASLLAILAHPSAAVGQQGSIPAAAGSNTVRADSALLRSEPASRPLTLLDAPVDRAEYRLGPGDVVDIGILGELNRVLSASVGPEGTMLVPGMGVARVLGMTLDQAERVVRGVVLRYYKGVDVRLTLAELRSFKVFVVGDVPNPGVRAATPATRVSEIVPYVRAASDPRDTTRQRDRDERRYRNVLLRRANGDSVVVDLVRFRQTGDFSANPTLREGDRLVMPATDRTVQVYGRVSFPGTYEYREGETLAQLLAVANGGGPFPSNAADTIRLTRFVTRDARELRVLTRAEASGAAGASLALQPFDAIYVPAVANYKEQRTAVITGQVLRPGRYPIRPETTTVRELVTLAGGFTPEASLSDATLRRAARTDVGPPPGRLDSLTRQVLTPEEQRLRQARESSDPTLVVVDFQQLFAQGTDALDQRLEDGDSLAVPTRTTGVAVLGAVTNPGIVPYGAGRGIDDYVRLAGGYARRADRRGRAVFKAKLGVRYTPREAGSVRSIDPGDQIVVPFRPRRDWLQTTYQIATSITGIVVSIYTVKTLVK